MTSLRIHFAALVRRLNAIFGPGLVTSMFVIGVAGVIAAALLLLLSNFSAPTSLTIATGPKDSAFQRYADKYREILAREGVKLKVLPTDGSSDNLRHLLDRHVDVDVGFVQGGEEIPQADAGNLVSLGSISYQAILVFYRGAPRRLLSDFKGGRLYVGKEGSGAHRLALALLKQNEIEPGGSTTLVTSLDGGDPRKALVGGQVDAIFVMGDSTSADAIRALLHEDDVHLFDVVQAEGYARRISYLNKLVLPEGAIDFGRDLPHEDVRLIGPTVELVARENLHPALIDLLLEAAKEVHGTASVFRKRGEFPSPAQHQFRLSPDASRYYTSGKTFLYRTFPFWFASLLARVLSVLVPLAILLLPALQAAPGIYRWRIRSRLFRWYRSLLEVEREALKPNLTLPRRDELLQKIEHIENSVNATFVPAAFGDLFYGLRGHIRFVRDGLLAIRPEGREAVAPAVG
ncbi:MAG TPA: TAXI family TRAP transporter solute-binding subunit [Burkholderiaceae bacterium]|nr:TAXI family TRAP transporter solute-binding subunit [Burkholderiaceae bacterium]